MILPFVRVLFRARPRRSAPRTGDHWGRGNRSRVRLQSQQVFQQFAQSCRKSIPFCHYSQFTATSVAVLESFRTNGNKCEMASVRKRTWNTAKGPKSAWVVAYMHKGKQHLKTFPTKRDAVAWRAEMQTEVKRGIHTPATTSITVATAGALWLAQAETDALEASTLAQY